jgi:hypothetical protein
VRVVSCRPIPQHQIAFELPPANLIGTTLNNCTIVVTLAHLVADDCSPNHKHAQLTDDIQMNEESSAIINEPTGKSALVQKRIRRSKIPHGRTASGGGIRSITYDGSATGRHCDMARRFRSHVLRPPTTPAVEEASGRWMMARSRECLRHNHLDCVEPHVPRTVRTMEAAPEMR